MKYYTNKEADALYEAGKSWIRLYSEIQGNKRQKR